MLQQVKPALEGYKLPGNEHSGISQLLLSTKIKTILVLNNSGLPVKFSRAANAEKHRQTQLESQPWGGLIAVKYFVWLSLPLMRFAPETMRQNNYRFVELCVQ